jgi:hypothetical protein
MFGDGVYANRMVDAWNGVMSQQIVLYVKRCMLCALYCRANGIRCRVRCSNADNNDMLKTAPGGEGVRCSVAPFVLNLENRCQEVFVERNFKCVLEL